MNKKPFVFKCDQIKLEVSAIMYNVSVQLTGNKANTKNHKLTTMPLGSPCLPAPDEALHHRALKQQADRPAHGCSLLGTLPDARGKPGTWCYLQRLAVFQGTAWGRGCSFASQNIRVQTGILLSLLRKS